MAQTRLKYTGEVQPKQGEKDPLTKQPRSRTRSIIWLNPIPASRWQNTTAAAIAEQLPKAMFEFTHQGLIKAIRYATALPNAFTNNTKKAGFSQKPAF